MQNVRDGAGDLKFYLFIYSFSCVYLFVHAVYVHYRHADPVEARTEHQSSGTRIMGSYKLPYGFWKMNLGHLHEQ